MTQYQIPVLVNVLYDRPVVFLVLHLNVK